MDTNIAAQLLSLVISALIGGLIVWLWLADWLADRFSNPGRLSGLPSAGRTARVVRIDVRRGETGMYFATSEDMPDLFLSVLNLEGLKSGIPLAIEGNAGEGRHMAAYMGDRADFAGDWIIVSDA